MMKKLVYIFILSLTYSFFIFGEDKNIKVGVIKSFPPGYSTSLNGEPQGFAIDTIEYISEKSNLTIEYIAKDNWEELFNSLENQEIDLIPNLGITDGRKSDFSFSNPIEVFPIHIFTRSSFKELPNINSLENLKVAVVKDNIGEILIQDVMNTEVIVFNNIENALFSLLSGNTDAIISPDSIILAVARAIDVESRIKSNGPVLVEIKRGISVLQGNEWILNKLNPIINKFILTEEYKKIYIKWYGKPIAFWNKTKVIIISIIFIFIFLLWSNISIKRIVKKRTKELQKSETTFRSLFEKAPLGTAYHKMIYNELGDPVNYRILKINHSYEMLTGIVNPVGKLITDAVPGIEMDPFNWIKVFGEVAKCGKEVRFQQKLDFNNRWYDLVAYQNEQDHFVTTFFEITERKLVEEALKESKSTVRKKLKEITEPMGDISSLKLSDIIDVDILKPLMEIFYQLTGMLGAIVETSGNILIAFGWQDICTNFSKCHPNNLKDCLLSKFGNCEDLSTGSSHTFYCKNNLWNTVTPLIIGGKHLGNVFIGQYFLEGEVPDTEYFRKLAITNGYDINEYLEAVKKVPIFSKETINKGIMFYSKLSEIISNLSFISIKQSRLIEKNKKTEFELIKAKERSQTSENYLSEIINNIGEPVFVKNDQSKIILANDAFCTLLNIPKEMIINKRVDTYVREEEREIFLKNDKQVLSDGIENINEETITVRGGETRIIITKKTRFMESNGEFVIVGIIHDITDIRRSEKALFRSEEQLHQSQKMDAIGQLAGGIAHDFNNSLSGIISATELILNGNNDKDKQKKYLNMIITSAERAGNLTKKLLFFSRKGDKLNVSIDITHIINETISILEHTINKNISISLINNSINSIIMGDAPILQNAFMNLAINSSQAMLEGGEIIFKLENIELDIEYCQNSTFNIIPGKYLKIEVHDTGSGMNDDIQSHVFEPFYTTKEQGKGTGIGLSTVYGGIKNHKGSINVYSEEGVGTVFYIYLPITDNKLPDVNVNKQIKGTGTILLIDDEEIVRETTKDMLISLGYDVICSEDGVKGVKLFSEKYMEIDLVILDMIMPNMGGREAFGKIREIKNDVPVILCSGFTKDLDLEILKNENISGFIYKPFRVNELSEVVSSILNK